MSMYLISSEELTRSKEGDLVILVHPARGSSDPLRPSYLYSSTYPIAQPRLGGEKLQESEEVLYRIHRAHESAVDEIWGDLQAHVKRDGFVVLDREMTKLLARLRSGPPYSDEDELVGTSFEEAKESYHAHLSISVTLYPSPRELRSGPSILCELTKKMLSSLTKPTLAQCLPVVKAFVPAFSRLEEAYLDSYFLHRFNLYTKGLL